MICYCCNREIRVARKVKVRRLTDLPKLSEPISKDHPAIVSHTEQNTYRWGIVCPGCYLRLDNELGVEVIAGQEFNISSVSRFDRARCITENDYQRWQGRQADKLFSSPKARR